MAEDAHRESAPDAHASRSPPPHDPFNGPRVPYEPPRLAIEEVGFRARRFFEEIGQRRSVRDFATTSVPRSTIAHLIRAASTAPSGAHMQPWHFAAVSNASLKARIRAAAEDEEKRSYSGRMSEEWRAALRPLGTTWSKPHLTEAPWLVVLFSQAWGVRDDGTRRKHYYVAESVGIAAGLFIAAVHQSGLATLPHTPSPMGFLADILGRPKNERATLLLPVGFPAADCSVPELSRKPLPEVSSWFED